MSGTAQSRAVRFAGTDVTFSGLGNKGIQLVEKEEQREKNLDGLRVLVVDDDPSIRQACTTITEDRACETYTAETLAKAQIILSGNKVDVVLLDMKLPDGSGISLLEQIKALHPETGVVVMTAYATVSSAVDAMRIGARDYLTKPFSMEEMLAVLERAAHWAHFERESRLLRLRLRSILNPVDGCSSAFGLSISRLLQCFAKDYCKASYLNISNLRQNWS